MISGGSRGPGQIPPTRTKMFSILCSFSKNFTKSNVDAPWGLAPFLSFTENRVSVPGDDAIFHLEKENEFFFNEGAICMYT